MLDQGISQSFIMHYLEDCIEKSGNFIREFIREMSSMSSIFPNEMCLCSCTVLQMESVTFYWSIFISVRPTNCEIGSHVIMRHSSLSLEVTNLFRNRFIIINGL